jgi:hypothetical protein
MLNDITQNKKTRQSGVCAEFRKGRFLTYEVCVCPDLQNGFCFVLDRKPGNQETLARVVKCHGGATQ